MYGTASPTVQLTRQGKAGCPDDGRKRFGRPVRRRRVSRLRLRTRAETNARLVSGVRDLVRVHLCRGGHLRNLRRRAPGRGPGRDLAVGHRRSRADPGGAGRSPIRGPHSAQRVLVSMGVAAGEPEDRVVVRMADILVSGHRRGGDGQRVGEPSAHATGRHGAEREHRATDHVGGVTHSGRAGDRFYPTARHDHVQRSRDRTRDRGGFGDRPWGRHAVHRQRHPRQPHRTGDHRRRPQLLRHRRRPDGRDDHGPHDAGRLRLRGELGRGGQGSVPQRPARDRLVGGGSGGTGPSLRRHPHHRASRTSRG